MRFLSIALLAVAKSLQFSAQFGADTLWQTKTVELVQAYSDEILTKRYDELTPIGGVPPCTSCSAESSFGSAQDSPSEVRGGGQNRFDDVDDYHGLNDSPPIDAQGNVRADYAGYRVEVSVNYAGLAHGLAVDTDAKQIQITVTPPGQSAVPFSVLRGNF